MNCIRCGKDLGHADSSNADYVIADDFISNEKRECYYAVNDRDEFIPIKQVADSLLIPNSKRVEVKTEDIPIQKTGLVCPDCYKETDTVIWGIHKK